MKKLLAFNMPVDIQIVPIMGQSVLLLLHME